MVANDYTVRKLLFCLLDLPVKLYWIEVLYIALDKLDHGLFIPFFLSVIKCKCSMKDFVSERYSSKPNHFEQLLFQIKLFCFFASIAL